MRLRPLLTILLLFSISLFGSTLHAAERIAGYRSVFVPYYGADKKIKIAFRRFTSNSKEKLVIVDPYTFDTFIVDSASIDTSRKVKLDTLAKTPFVKALNRYTAPDGRLQNSGITKGETGVKGLFLTIDMCPSKKPFEKGLFTSTVEVSRDKPVPVAIAASGLWIEKHKEEFDWIMGEAKGGRLSVTWVNHTYSHPYDTEKPLEVNFMLTPGVDFEKEVLKEEAVLIEHGAVPSPFFRFPGLVSSGKLLLRLKKLSLIPIGSNAWVAKGEAPKNGSIILVHGNGNEPEGIKTLIEFYGKNSGEFAKGEQLLLPLKDAFGR